MISSTKIVAATGVPNSAENSAAMPQSWKMRRLSFSGFTMRDIATPMEPPNWSAAPSRPAEPPVRCVSAVEMKIAGAIRMDTPSWVCTVLMISSVPMDRGSFSSR